MFIAFIGLKNSGIIVANPATFVALGSFTPNATLGAIAIILSGVLVARRIKGALFYGIIVATLVGIPLGVTDIPDGWLPVSAPHSVSPIFCQFDFNNFFTLQTALVLFSLLMVNIFDTVGTLVGLAEKTGIVQMLESVKKIELGDVSEAFPAFITMITMILCYSIADGICLGILSFVIIKLCTSRWRDLNVTLVVLSLLFVINFIFKE